MLVHETEPYNAEPPPRALADRPLTPPDAHYVRSHGPVPATATAPAPDDWELTVDGLVSRPLRLPLGELRRRFPAHEVTATLQCAGNRRTGLTEVREIPGEAEWGPGAISTARWRGVRLRDVLAAAGLADGAAHIAFTAPDVSAGARPPQGFGGSVPVAKALSEEVLLAWEMNGRPLPPVHGAPLRAVVPGWIGARSVKWLDRITARAEPSDNYFQTTAYRLLPPDADHRRTDGDTGLSLGPAVLNCAILRPAEGSVLFPGVAEVSGYAFAGDGRGVARVDVSLDGGHHWTQAELGADQGPWAWRLWRTTVQLPPAPQEYARPRTERTGRKAAPDGPGSAVAGGTPVTPGAAPAATTTSAAALEAPASPAASAASLPLEITARAWDTSGGAQPESAAPLWNPGGYVNNSWPRVHIGVREH